MAKVDPQVEQDAVERTNVPPPRGLAAAQEEMQIAQYEGETASPQDVDTGAALAIFNSDTGQDFFSSIQGQDRETRIKIYNALGAAQSLSDNLGLIISTTDIVAHAVRLPEVEQRTINGQQVSVPTGKTIETLRVVLIAEDGQTYAAISRGINSSLQRLFAVVGKPTWNPSIPLVAAEEKTRSGFKTMVFRIASQ